MQQKLGNILKNKLLTDSWSVPTRILKIYNLPIVVIYFDWFVDKGGKSNVDSIRNV